MTRMSTAAVVGRAESELLPVLRRLLAQPEGRRLYGSGRSPGLFPSRSVGSERIVADLNERGFITLVDPENDRQGPTALLTAEGRRWLVDHDSPRELLEDLLRVGEDQRDILRELATLLAEHERRLERQRQAVAAVLTRLASETAADSPCEALALQILAVRDPRGELAVRSFADLYEEIRLRQPGLSIGAFHDAIRRLYDQSKIRLCPWTGPLYELPQPALALLIGHEVLYYVQLTRDTLSQTHGYRYASERAAEA